MQHSMQTGDILMYHTTLHLIFSYNALCFSVLSQCKSKNTTNRMCGMPTPPCSILYSLLSYRSCGCLALCDSSFTANS